MSDALQRAVGGGHRESILVVDGDALSRNIADQVLRHHGYQAVLAANMADALLACAMIVRIDLLVVDAANTGVPGEIVATRLRYRYPNLRCLYVGSRTSLERSVAHDLEPIIVKPFGIRTFLRAIHTALHSH